MPSPSQVIVVLEDERHEMLLRRYLRKRGMEPHQVRFERSPSGQGSAERWVRARFVSEVRAYRSRRARAETALILMIDADTHTVQDRLLQLTQALEESGVPIVGIGEQIAQLVPKRNVETWILCLAGLAVDEETDYKWARYEWKELIPGASEALSQLTRPNIKPSNQCTDSLSRGIHQLKSLTF